MMKPVEMEVREAEEQLRTAMLTNDVAALAVLLDDELEFAGPDGAVVRKQDDIAAHAARRLRLNRLDVQECVIEENGPMVSVRVRAVLAGTFDGTPCDGTYRYARTWRKNAGRWQVIAGGVSTASDAASAQ